MKTVLFLLVLFLVPFGSVSAKIQDREISEVDPISDQEKAQRLGITLRQYRVYVSFLHYGEILEDLPIGPPIKKAAQSILSLSRATTVYESQVAPQMKSEKDAGRRTISSELGEKFKAQVILVAVLGLQDLVEASVEMNIAVNKLEHETCSSLREAESNANCLLKFGDFHKITNAFIQASETMTVVVNRMLQTYEDALNSY